MSDWFRYDYGKFDRYRAAKAAVLAKFPSIIEGSTGWYRALKVQQRKQR